MDPKDHQPLDGFDQLLRPHMERLYRLAWRLCGNKSEAEDLFQDVLTKIYVRLDDLADISEPATWLCRVMYNHFVDDRRKYSRQRMVIVSEAALPEQSVESLAGSDSPSDNAERADRLLRLGDALAQLSDEHHEVIQFHDIEGYKLKEIQEITGDPVGTVKSRLHRARARLREILANDGTFF